MERPALLTSKPLGPPEFSDRDAAAIVLPDLDYEAQLAAVYGLLRNNKKADEELIQEIDKIKAFAERAMGLRNEHAVDELIDRYHSSVYQDAAHSMAAVGMLAPLFESIFAQGLRGIGTHFFAVTGLPLHDRFEHGKHDAWDCHNFWSGGRRHINVVQGILQLSDAIGLTSHLPTDTRLTLEALFAYRNKMFHHGFEWPMDVRRNFDITRRHWPGWFDTATSGGEPWVFYMSPVFVEHCLDRVDKFICAFGSYCNERLRER